jgi:hypothetical protein
MAIIGSLYHDVEVCTTTETCPIGVSCAAMTVTTYPFGWVQTKGVVGVLCDAKAPTVGAIVTVSKITAGAVGPMGGDSVSAVDLTKNPIVGYVVDPGDSAGQVTCKINLE